MFPAASLCRILSSFSLAESTKLMNSAIANQLLRDSNIIWHID